MYTRTITPPNEKSFFLFGPRGVGKTLWIKRTFPNGIYFDLLDSEVHTRLVASPRRIADLIPLGFTDWVIIDEVQRIPEILNEVHRLIEARCIKFILTGSSARKLRRSGVNLLAGRALTKFMHPLTIDELGADFTLEHSLKYGTLPSGYVEDDPVGYLKSYIGTYLREEVLQEGLTRNMGAFTRFLETASFSQGSPLNMAGVSRDCAVQTKVVEDYFTILEDLLIAVRIPVFSRRAKRKLSVHPKFFFFDAGVFQTLRPRGPLDSTDEISGAALETLFLQQIRALNDYHDYGYAISFWRTTSKQEVDFVLYGERGLLAFELKLGDRIRSDDLTGLRMFLEDYPEAHGYCLYTGSREWHEHGVEIMNVENALRHAKQLMTQKS